MSDALKTRHAELVEKHHNMRLRRECEYLEAELGLDTERQLESYRPDYANLSREDIARETGYGGFLAYQISQADDMKDGQFRPLYENEQHIAEARGVGRIMSSTDEVGINIRSNIRNYTIGEGFTVEATARDKTADAQHWAEELQKFVDDFAEKNDWQADAESDAFLSSVEDGEVLLRLMPCGCDAPRVEQWTGEHIVEPGDPRAVEDYIGVPMLEWKFGVAADLGNPGAVYGYFLDPFASGDWDFVPSEHSVFIKRNVPRIAKRGYSDFAVPFKTTMKAAKLHDRVALGATIQASIAFIIKAAAGTPSASLSGLVTGDTFGYESAQHPNGQAGTVRTENFQGGKVIRTNANYEHSAMGSPQGPTFMQVYQAMLRRVGSRWAMPEYMVSGDASNANYSSTMVAESPFIQQTLHEQRAYARKQRELLWKAADMAAKAGRFGGYSASDLKRLVSLEITAPNPEVRDPAQQEAVYDAQQAAGVLSARTRAQKSGLDYDDEVAAGAEKQTALPVVSPPLPESAEHALRFSVL